MQLVSSAAAGRQACLQQHPKRGHFVPPFWILTAASLNWPGNILIGLFYPQNIWFDIKKSTLHCTVRSVPEILDAENWWQPSWKMTPCANCTHFWRCHHAVSWPHILMIDSSHADKCCYSAATYSKIRAFLGQHIIGCCPLNHIWIELWYGFAHHCLLYQLIRLLIGVICKILFIAISYFFFVLKHFLSLIYV